MAVLDFCGRSAKDKKTQGYTDLKSVPAKAGYGFRIPSSAVHRHTVLISNLPQSEWQPNDHFLFQ
jgi:hypothetical protein